MRRKGVSTVIATVLLVAITVVLASLVWIFAQSMFTKHEDIAKIIVLRADVDYYKKNFTISIARMPGVPVMVETLNYQVVNVSGGIFAPPGIKLFSGNGSEKSSGALESTDYWKMPYNETYVEFRIFGPSSIQGTVKLK